MNRSELPQLYLASTSPYRAELLGRLKIPFETRDPAVDETPIPGEQPKTLALRLAKMKAQSNTLDQGIIIGSDQVAACEGETLGKPGNRANAHAQLSYCSGKVVTFYTALALWIPNVQLLLTEVVPFEVTLRSLSSAEIDRYLAFDQPFDCAGSFKWEALGISLFDRMDGNDPTSLQGLPLIALCRLLRAQSVAIPPVIQTINQRLQ